MKSKERAKKPTRRWRIQNILRKGLGLQARMTISYIGMSLVIVLLVELLISLVIFFALISPGVDDVLMNTAQRTARVYALEAALQGSGTTLDPHITFQPGHPSSLEVSGNASSSWLEEILSERVPYVNTQPSRSQATTFALLIAPNGQVLASSYPSRYPVSTPVAKLLPNQEVLIQNALAGNSGSTTADTAQGRTAFAAQTILSREKKPLGAVYVQISSGLLGGQVFSTLAWSWLRSGLPWLLFMIPIGGVFGLLTTRGLVQRIRRLATTTTQFAAGHFELRLPASGKDEVGQLEHSFNQMAEQLIESMAQQRRLTEQQARLEERARIEQELRTARYIQQALLPKEVPQLPHWQLTPFYQPAREVGGDFYDFHLLEDGRLGIVIGDATDKGMSAALLMATTCTMLRTAAQGMTSPGEVLARVNDLLTTTIPSGMFATCFYALLDPHNGTLRYANAGHDTPYRYHDGAVCELYATGMPLGMMPGMHYEEREATLEPGASLLFYSDGLVEAHNAKRDMFGFPRLKTLLEEHCAETSETPETSKIDASSLIACLLSELKSFAGDGWEQEDDVTLVTLQRTSESLKRNEQ